MRAAALLGVVIVMGCAARSRRGPVEPAAVIIAPGDLMSATDRARLEALIAERAAQHGGEGYRIGPDDLLNIRIPDLPGLAPPMTGDQPAAGAAAVAAAPQFQQGLRVGAGGDLNVPLLGFVRAEGLTAQELEGEIAERLKSAGILRAPQVSVLVAEYRSRVVAVVGSVERPGLYPVTRPGATLTDLIWAAGGPSRDAGRVVAFTPVGAPAQTTRPREVVAMAMIAEPAGALEIQRVDSEPSGGGRRMRIELSRPPTAMRTFSLEAPPRLVIDCEGPAAAGVATARFVVEDPIAVGVRASARDGSLRVVVDLKQPLISRIAVVNGSVLVVDLGPTVPDLPVPARDRASTQPVVAPRPTSAAQERPPAREQGPIRIDLALLLGAPGFEAGPFNPPVRAGDVVSVSPAGSVQVAGWVEKPGSYPVTRSLTLSGAVAAAGGESFAASPGRTRVARVLGPDEKRAFSVDLVAVAEGREADVPIVDGDVVYLPPSPLRIVPWALWSLAGSMLRLGATIPIF